METDHMPPNRRTSPWPGLPLALLAALAVYGCGADERGAPGPVSAGPSTSVSWGESGDAPSADQRIIDLVAGTYMSGPSAIAVRWWDVAPF